MQVRYADTKLEAIFFKMVHTYISFHPLAKDLCNECFVSICWSNLFSALAAGTLWKLNPGLFLQEFVQPNTVQVATMMTLWKITTVFWSSSWNFLSLHYITYFIHQILQISTKNVTLQVLFRGTSWENIHFYGFWKKTYIANGKKIKVNSSKKYVKFLSSGYFFPLYISPLICITFF